MATDFPNAQITATDLSPVQPSTVKPVNLTFGIDDFTQPLPYETGTFDLVRLRFAILSLKADQWEHVIHEMARVVKPGGYLEMVEPEWLEDENGDARGWEEFLGIREYQYPSLPRALPNTKMRNTH